MNALLEARIRAQIIPRPSPVRAPAVGSEDSPGTSSQRPPRTKRLADSAKPELDMCEGFLAVIDRLAGRARHVAVATHDAPLAQEALERLLKTKTSCELELLYGLPLKRALQVAQAAGVGVRLYLPYGHGCLPYSISQVYENPRILWWVLRDLGGRRSRLYGS